MIVTIHQPEHLPWLGFFHKLYHAEQVVLLDNVQFRKNYFQNRNRILTTSGRQWLTVPVLSKGRSTAPIDQIPINEAVNWRRKYLETLRQSYRRHPYFPVYAPDIEGILHHKWENLVDLNMAIIELFLKALGSQRQLIRASELFVQGNRSNLLLAICQEMGADIYLSGPSGEEYLDEEIFHDAGIGVCYHEFHHPTYLQANWSGPFISSLSTVDLLFNVGPNSLDTLLGKRPSK